MGTQRYIDTSFWDDAWIQELDPSQKFVYMYLLTNPLTNVAGISELTIKRICFDTGYNAETVKCILNRFQADDKVYRWDNYIILKNAPKHQTLVKSKDGNENEMKVTNIYKGIVAILNQLPDELIAYLYHIGYAFDLSTIIEERGLEIDEDCTISECLNKGSEGFQRVSEGLNYSDINSNSNSNLNNKEIPKKQKKEPLRNREPINDYEKLEKTYINLWDSLYSQNKVSTRDPIITDWSVIKKLEKSLLQTIPVDVLQKAIEKSVNNDFVIQNGYSLQIILSGNVINKLINGNVTQNNYQQQKNDDAIKKSLANKIGLEEWHG